MSVHEHGLADVGAVRHLDLVGKLARALHAANQARAVDDDAGRGPQVARAQARGFARRLVLRRVGDDGGYCPRARLGSTQLRVRVEIDVRHCDPVDGRQVPR
jgi:hypothetical protein